MIAVIAAAHAQRVQAITDAFRLAGATAPERAKSLDALGLVRGAEVDELARVGVLVSDRGGTWYLSEAAVVARRQAGARTPRWILFAVLFLVVLGVVALGVLIASQR